MEAIELVLFRPGAGADVEAATRFAAAVKGDEERCAGGGVGDEELRALAVGVVGRGREIEDAPRSAGRRRTGFGGEARLGRRAAMARSERERERHRGEPEEEISAVESLGNAGIAA
jgi:hypothetical protein